MIDGSSVVSAAYTSKPPYQASGSWKRSRRMVASTRVKMSVGGEGETYPEAAARVLMDDKAALRHWPSRAR